MAPLTETDLVLFVPIEVEMSADRAKREVTFYGSAFGNRDSQGMRVVKGAFDRGIRERHPQGLIKHFRNHEKLMGPMRHLEEDSYGLLCVGFCSKTPAGDEYLEQVIDKSITHASFRAGIVRDRAHWIKETDPNTGEEIETLNLTELILKEAGGVDLEPANLMATIQAVKSFDDSALDTVLELPYILKSFSLTRRGVDLTAEERRIAKSLLLLHDVLGEQSDTLKALLAPGDITPPPSGAAPSLATPANAEKQPDLSILLASLQQRGRIPL